MHAVPAVRYHLCTCCTRHASISRCSMYPQNSYNSRDPISWQPVQCAVGDSPLHYSFQGSNPWYLKLQVSNGRCTLAR